ncbi:hypothetical protein KIN20_035846 [Parelaphostrongylus tenuis]|uniref:Uncharacterized protein n=1 Tax=Parelaphostrongylus tenuis TaxID=148309 RepID=A0AAD5WK94_PARTN|nr:hypothetical protein KIN20_035846 [Parelaphostrongylus tenuis]
MGRIISIQQSDNGAVREAQERVPNGRTIRRPINPLIPLELDDDVQPPRAVDVNDDQQSKEEPEERRYNLRSRAKVRDGTTCATKTRPTSSNPLTSTQKTQPPKFNLYLHCYTSLTTSLQVLSRSRTKQRAQWTTNLAFSAPAIATPCNIHCYFILSFYMSDNMMCSIVKVNLNASGGGCATGGLVRSWGTQTMGRRRRQSSAFNWSLRPSGSLSSSYSFPSPFSLSIAYNCCL